MDVVLDALNGFRGKVNSTKMKVNGEDEYLRGGGVRGAVRTRCTDANFTVHYPLQFFNQSRTRIGERDSLAVHHSCRGFSVIFFKTVVSNYKVMN